MKLKFSYDETCPHQTAAVSQFLIELQKAKTKTAIDKNVGFIPKMIPNSKMVQSPTDKSGILEILAEQRGDAEIEAANAEGLKRDEERKAIDFEKVNAEKAKFQKDEANRRRREKAAEKKKLEAEKLAKLDEQSSSAPTEETDDEESAAPTVDEVRAVLRVKGKTHKPDILKYLAEIKTKSLTVMDKADYPAFLEFLNGLK